MTVVESPVRRPGKRLMLSPLRYPGGKGMLYTTLRELIRANDLGRGTYVEPYAGGAGAGLALLMTGEVRRIVINDLDPAIYAFWRSVTKEPAEFARKVERAPLTVAEWRKQKRIYTTADRTDYLALGFATFYLNRTNRSGVLNGGPIGGLDQSGTYKIDARFNRKALLERLRLIALNSSSIVVLRQDGRSVIKRYGAKEQTFIYADPPYVEKAGTLYMNSFADENHSALATCLAGIRAARWVLTYDDVDRVEALYNNFRRERYSLSYSAHRAERGRELMIFSDKLVVPWLPAHASRSVRR